MFNRVKHSLGIDISQSSIKLILLEQKANQINEVLAVNEPIELEASLNLTLQKLVQQHLAKRYRFNKLLLACNVPMSSVMQREIALPTDMDDQDIYAHVELSKKEYFPEINSELICDFERLLKATEAATQTIHLYAIKEETINHYLNLIKPFKSRLNYLEPEVLSLWRAFCYLIKPNQPTCFIDCSQGRCTILLGAGQKFTCSEELFLSKENQTGLSQLNQLLQKLLLQHALGVNQCYLSGSDEHFENIAELLKTELSWEIKSIKKPQQDSMVAYGLALRGLINEFD